ncbi:antiviral reverse transcriptase Drt3a [Mucilaginibacter phyllosphaerae]
MLDQSFSPDNFRTIMQVLNRKGIYVEKEGKFVLDVFSASRAESNKLLHISHKIKTEKDRLWIIAKAARVPFDYTTYQNFKNKLAEEKAQIKIKREEILDNILLELSKTTNVESYKIGVNKGDVKWGKQLFVDNKTAEDFFVLRQIQYNLKKSFRVKPSDRTQILSQLVTLLDDKFPKLIIKADISSFYENINHELLIGKINSNNVLSSPSKRLIKQVLNKYWQLLIIDGVKNVGDVRVGIPRGLGISAYLAEVYMRDFDNSIKSLPNVTYYARYVDDIILIVTPGSRGDSKSQDDYIASIKDTLNQKSELQLNLEKTEAVDLRPYLFKITSSTTLRMTFLGYKFVFKYRVDRSEGSDPSVILLPVFIGMSDVRKRRYANKILKAFEIFEIDKSRYLKKANRLLIKRIQYLTGNTKLIGNKSNVFVGIYFSNLQLTSPQTDLDFLDKILTLKIDSLADNAQYLKARLSKFKFQIGYQKKFFQTYKLSVLDEILKIWK